MDQTMEVSENNKLSISEARAFFVNYQGLNDRNQGDPAAEVLEYIGKAGCIQYDPLNMVGRNADLVLQSRIKGYRSKVLEDLLYEDRSLIDGWDKMMSIYIQSDWPFVKRIRDRKGVELIHTLARRNSIQALELLGEVKNYISEQGPTASGKIDMGGSDPGRWGHKKLSSAALDYLFHIGEVGVYEKKNTQKIYDLIENLLPKEALLRQDPFSSEDEFFEWYVQRRIGGVGMLWQRNGGAWLGYGISDKKIRDKAITSLIEQGILEAFSIEGIPCPFFMRKRDTGYLNAEAEQSEMKFLAPLDNLMWDRALISQVFHFDYSWEVYTPVVKRKYGYYVLPVLYQNCFVGRFEPEMYRGEGELRIKQWWWEEGVTITEEMLSALKRALKSFCEYLGADCVAKEDLERVTGKR